MLASDMKSVAMSLLSRLQSYPAVDNRSKSAVNVEELVQLYCYSLDLNPFDEGQHVALYLLQKHKAALASYTKRLPELLGKHANKLMGLMQVLQATGNAEPTAPITAQMLGAISDFMTVKDALRKLYEQHEKGDFEIAIKGTDQKLRAHSFVLYALWPYFRLLFDTNMKEKQQMRLELPAVGQDGGISLEMLELIVELCYNPDALSEERVNEALALDALAIANLYLLDFEGEGQSDGPLDHLAKFAESQWPQR